MDAHVSKNVAVIRMSSKRKTVVSLLNGPLSKLNGLKFKPELLQRMDSLYAFYHKQWWCYRKMLNHFKFVNALFNGLALLLMAAGMIAGPLLENSTLVACLAAVGTVVKGWNDFKQYRFKVTMSRFAFTTYAKALTELKTYVRGVPFEDLERFLIKMQTLDDTLWISPLRYPNGVYKITAVILCTNPWKPYAMWTDVLVP